MKLSTIAQLLVLLCTIAVAGCSSKNYAYTTVNNQFVRFQLPPEWKIRQSSGFLKVYTHPKYGDLTVSVLKPEDLQRQLMIRFNTTVAQKGEQNFGQQMAGAAALLEPVKSEPAVAEALECLAKIPKNVEGKDTGPAVAEWTKAQQSLAKVAGDPSDASLLVHALAKVKFPLSKPPEPIQDLQVGVKAVRIEGQCFVLWMGNLVCIETFGPAKDTPELSSMLKTVEINTLRLQGAELTQPHRVASSSNSRRSSYDLTSIGLYLMFIAGPSFFGAWTGYHSAEEPPKGAASGAFLSTVCGSTLATGIGVIMILGWGANAPRGSGVMTAGVAAFIFACVALVGGVVASGLLAALASLGARIGARGGAFMAGLSAVFFPILMVAAIVLFQYAKSMSGV